MKKKTLFLLLPLMWMAQNGFAQCADSQNVFAFTHNGKNYEIIKENKNWADAAACAVNRGGYLAEVNNQAENDAIFNQLALVGVNPDDTPATDGFSSYIWLGGNDISVEGKWFWNGNNDATGTPFWQGTATGTAVGGRFSNWGNEPDNWGGGVGQDGLGMAVIDFPNGAAGEWNDISHNNTLFFVVEFNPVMGIDRVTETSGITFYPNPAQDVVTITAGSTVTAVTLYTLAGQQVKAIDGNVLHNNQVPVAGLPAGVYIINVSLDDATTVTKKLIKL